MDSMHSSSDVKYGSTTIVATCHVPIANLLVRQNPCQTMQPTVCWPSPFLGNTWTSIGQCLHPHWLNSTSTPIPFPNQSTRTRHTPWRIHVVFHDQTSTNGVGNFFCPCRPGSSATTQCILIDSIHPWRTTWLPRPRDSPMSHFAAVYWTWGSLFLRTFRWTTGLFSSERSPTLERNICIQCTDELSFQHWKFAEAPMPRRLPWTGACKWPLAFLVLNPSSGQTTNL